MWIARGLLLGSGLFVIGCLVFLKLTLFGHQQGSTATGLNAITGITLENPFFWVAFFASLVIGVCIIGSWPVRIA